MDERVGLVMAGAGARGAYEAGALSVLWPRMAARGAAPQVLVGTSAGALNVVALGGLAALPPDEVGERLIQLWEKVHLTDVVDVPRSVISTARDYGAQVFGLGGRRLRSLLDTRPQPETMRRLLGPLLAQLHANVRAGVVLAVAVAASSVRTRGTVVFVERNESVRLPDYDRRRDIEYVDAELSVEHVLASAAVPIAFAPVRVDLPVRQAGWYVDGGVRLNVPLKPALRMGCTHLGVVATHPAVLSRPDGPEAPGSPPPDVFAVAAVAFRSLLSDRMVEDLQTLSTVNALVKAAPAGAHRRTTFEFAGPPPERAGALGRLATEVFERSYAGRNAGSSPSLWALDRLIGGAAEDHGELLSFLFFDPAFARAASQLGREHVEAAPAATLISVDELGDGVGGGSAERREQ